ncbi:hypothetical protein K435DRAFT_657563, partial [Dendrothele bispora CBS 962.96]
IRLNIPSTICDLLFEYMYNGPRTNLETISFERLIELTEAAEEYKVYSAIDCCKHALRKHVPTNPLEVMRIAAKYGYSDELMQAAPFAIDTSLPVMSSILPPSLHMAWVSLFLYLIKFYVNLNSDPITLSVVTANNSSTPTASPPSLTLLSIDANTGTTSFSAF